MSNYRRKAGHKAVLNYLDKMYENWNFQRVFLTYKITALQFILQNLCPKFYPNTDNCCFLSIKNYAITTNSIHIKNYTKVGQTVAKKVKII